MKLKDLGDFGDTASAAQWGDKTVDNKFRQGKQNQKRLMEHSEVRG